MNIQTIDINNLSVSPLNVRKITNEDTQSNLRENIQTYGLINPLTVKFNNDTKMYEIIAGQRRYYAMKELNYTNIQCYVISDNTQEKEQIIMSLTENIHRDNMKLSDIVKTYNKLIAKYIDIEKNVDEAIEEVSKITHTDKKIIKQYRILYDFPDSILDYLDKQGNERMTIDFAIKLSLLKITSEKELVNIIKIFNDVNQSDRNKLLTQINRVIRDMEPGEKIEFSKIIEKIGKIKLAFLEDIRKKREDQNKLKKEAEEIIKKRKEAEKQAIAEAIVEKKELVKIPEVKEENIIEYNNKIKKIIAKNNNSVYISTETRNPKLQNLYREAITNRFNKCIISDMDNEVCEAAHIIPLTESKESESFDYDNGLLLNSVLHKLFDKHYWSICPETMCVKIFISSDKVNIYNILKPYENKCLEILKKYNNIIKYLESHYNKAIEKFKN
jgi:ParB/RepB/Spo0J family partition protein